MSSEDTPPDDPELPTEQLLVRDVTRVLEPIVTAAERSATGNPAAIERFFDRTGLGRAALGDAYPSIRATVETLGSDWTTIQTLVVDPLEAGDVPDVADLDEIIAAFRRLFETITDLDDIAVPDPDTAALGERVLEFLLLEYLRTYRRQSYQLLALAGVVVETREGVPDELHLDVLPEALSDPTALATSSFGWGGDAFDASVVLSYLAELLWARGVTSSFVTPDAAEVEALAGAELDEDGELSPELVVPLVPLGPGEGDMLGVRLVPVPGADGQPPGIAVVPLGLADADETVELGGGWSLSTALSAAIEGQGFVLRPDEDAALRTLSGDAGNVRFSGEAELAYDATADGAASGYRTLLGDPEGTRLALGTLAARVSAEYADGSAAFDVGLPASGRAAIDPADGDGFLRKVLPEGGFQYDFDVTPGYNSETGVYLGNEGTLDVSIPSHFEFGPVTLAEVYLGVSPDTDAAGIDLEGALSGAVDIGPLSATVDRVGIEASVSFPPGGGDFGPADVAVGFKPPLGLGVSIDTASVTGGGYLYFDADNERYAGALQLEFGTIAVNAVGLLTTQLPDGRDGFSLLILISGEFPPLQLGLGFTLNAVGGLLGFNRATEVGVLQSGLRDGTLGSVLFPEDVVENAPQIVSDLRRVFPPTADQHVVGPMARLGWGTPSVITADIGVLLSFPRPKLVILGRLQAIFPDEAAAVLALRMDALGVIDFDAGAAAVDASLYDSRIAAYTLTGDMAMRTRWKTDATFALSVGGFHPAFEPPPEFPELRRVAVSLADGDNPRLRMDGYFATTSNTVQAGARIDLYAGAAGFSVTGMLGFDALFQFDPFKLLVDLAGKVTLRGGPFTVGVGLDVRLSGPGPWRAKGTASFEFLFITAKVRFDATIGERVERSPLPPASVLDPLAAAVGEPGNWDAQLPDGDHSYVTLRKLDPGDGEVLVHPLGSLTVRERTVPLDVTIQTFGSATPVEGNRFALVPSDTSAAAGDADPDPVREKFAPAQFLELSDAEKLARPSFERFPAGRTIRNSDVAYGGGEDRVPSDPEGDGSHDSGGVDPDSEVPQSTAATLTYETEILSTDAPAGETETGGHTLPATTATALGSAGAVATGPARTTGAARFATDSSLGLSVSQPGYVVATTDDLTERPGVGDPVAATVTPTTDGGDDADATPLDSGARSGRLTYTEARERLDRHVAASPGDREQLQVVARHELDADEGGEGE